MVKRFLETITLAGLLALVLPGVLEAQTLPATITVNAATTLTSFIPISIFGNNAAYWIGSTNNTAVQPKVQAAGNYFIRFPGGSSSDDYHWNGTGSFDSNGYWVPSGTTWTYGWVANETYRGTTSSYGNASHLTDGNAGTTWLSNVDTDFPNGQWAELDLSASSAVNSVSILWGTPYASSFQVQYWPSTGWPPPLADNSSNKWITTSAGTVSGTAGSQTVSFTAVNAQYFRILLTASSAGAGGAYAIREVYLFNGASQVSVNNATSTVQTAVEVSSTDPAGSMNYTTNPPGSTDFGSFMTYAHSFTPNAIPLITVNVGTGTASEAASWVNYANNVQHYGIKYWQIGNETEGNWETGGPLPAQDYVRCYIEYYTAMKAADPTIIITGPVAGSFGDTSNMYDGKSYVQDFIAILAAKGAIGDLNAVDYHWYPNYGGYTAASALASTSTLDAFPAQLNGWLSAASVPNYQNVPVLMSEYNVDPGDENFQVQLGNGLWVADALGHFIKDFGNRGYSNLWDTLNGGSSGTSTTGGDLGYLNVNNDGYQYQPRATYWAMQMMTNDWAKPGDTASHQLISTTDSLPASLFAAYSDYRPDGIFSLLVVNKDPTNSYKTQISGIPFPPNATANGYSFSAANYAWETTTTPYHASTDTAPTAISISNASATSFPVTFQPYSITVLQFTEPSTATPTPTKTPTVTVTFTPTSSATPSGTPTATATATPTVTWTWTATPTGSWNTSTPTDTPTLTPSSTPTSTPSLTPSVTPTFTPSLTPTSSATSTRTLTATLTPTSTITLTPTITDTFTWTPTPASVNLLYPNPVYGNMPVNFNYNVTSPVDQVKVKLFTLSFRKIYEDDSLPTAVGQDSYTLDFGKAGLNLANGLYYVVLYWKTGDKETHQVMKLLVQR